MTKKIVLFFIVTTLISTLSMAQKETADVIITTDSGKIYIRLFDEAPNHKANFMKLAGEGFYDGIAFHRIIKNFMIQTGNPAFKSPTPSSQDGPGYMIDAEIVPKYVHTRGMLAAARMGDNVNPEWKSSGSQFYIVTGNSVTDEQLDMAEMNISKAMGNRQVPELQKIFLGTPENATAFAAYQTALQAKDPNAQALGNDLNKKFSDYVAANIKPYEFKYTTEQKEAYRLKGGSPWLDMQYTIFGEVVEGMDVVAKLEAVKTAPGDKPIQDVRMIKVEVIKK